MVAALTSLGARADLITPIFITVDPSRDSAAPLARYVGLFSPRLVGLTGSQAQIDAVVSAYRVYVQKLAPASPGAAYLVNHSAFMYLMNPQGKLPARHQDRRSGPPADGGYGRHASLLTHAASR
jgi:protein SCO1/2